MRVCAEAPTPPKTHTHNQTNKPHPKQNQKGDALLSRFVNALIASPLYGLMKVAAKSAMKGSVDGRGVSWDGTVAALRADGAALEELRTRFAAQPPGEDAYPSYYLKPFHAYAEGNLNWLASYEVEPASYVMAVRTFKDQPELSAAAALAKLRNGITGAVTVKDVVCERVRVSFVFRGASTPDSQRVVKRGDCSAPAPADAPPTLQPYPP